MESMIMDPLRPDTLVSYRKDTADRGTIDDVMRGYHRPPEDLEPMTILDLGAHAGFTAVDMLTEKRRPYVYSVEPDADNYQMLVANVGGFPRARTMRAAVGAEPGTGAVYGPANNAYKVSAGGDFMVYTVNGLLDHFGLPFVDYIKMDVEGAEEGILKDTTWGPRVKMAVKVELHDNYTHEEAMRLLFDQGFHRVGRDLDHPYCVYGVKRLASES